MPAVAHMDGASTHEKLFVGPNINYVENLVRVLQSLTPPSVHSRADEIYNFNFKWWNTLRKNVGIIFFKTL